MPLNLAHRSEGGELRIIEYPSTSASGLRTLPPVYSNPEASSSAHPPPFSSLYETEEIGDPTRLENIVQFPDSNRDSPENNPIVLPLVPACNIPDSPSPTNLPSAPRHSNPDSKQDGSRCPKTLCSKEEELEPPPAYSEGPSPLLSFNYLMASAGGASSIITQVQQGGPPTNALGGNVHLIITGLGYGDQLTRNPPPQQRCWRGRNNYNGPKVNTARSRRQYLFSTLTLERKRGTRFVLSRDELLTLPEFVLLSLFPNGLFPEGHMGGFSEGDAIQVDVMSSPSLSKAGITNLPSLV